MNYNLIEKSYFETQITRIVDSLKKLKGDQATAGRIVPQTDDLVIGKGRRLKMAIMFIDICGFSSRPSENETDQKQILSALTIFFTEMIRIAEDYGGTVEKNTGDGLMAYFEDGGGNPSENGVNRAMACALTMMATNSNVIDLVLDAIGVKKIEFRVTIDYGWVTIARLGAAKRFNSVVAIGTTANVASKMLSFAKEGEILIGERVRDALPIGWQYWTQRLDVSTGWIYIQSGTTYPFYRYNGRWKSDFLEK